MSVMQIMDSIAIQETKVRLGENNMHPVAIMRARVASIHARFM
jgi:hypothetical protein